MISVHTDNILEDSHYNELINSTQTSIILKGNFSPIERVFLTSNGNLQRILSAYFNNTIEVDIIFNIISTQKKFNIIERKVHLKCKDNILCKATSFITISDDILNIMKSKNLAVGQMFKYLEKLPTFVLHSVGRLEDISIFREYTLEVTGFCCRIREEFISDIENLIL